MRVAALLDGYVLHVFVPDGKGVELVEEADTPFQRLKGVVTFDGMSYLLGSFDELAVGNTGG